MASVLRTRPPVGQQHEEIGCADGAVAVEVGGAALPLPSRSTFFVTSSNEWSGYAFVDLKEILEPPALIREWLGPVYTVHRAVERAVSAAKGRGHAERIVQVGERRIRELRSCVKHALRCGFNALPLRVRRRLRPREVVVDKTGRVLIVGPHSPADLPHLCHVHR